MSKPSFVDPMEMILLIGLPGCGKSSFYHVTFATTHLRINLDMLRTRRREAAILDACLASGQRCVIDNTNPSVADRSIYLQKAADARFASDAYVFNVGFDICMVRNAKRDGRARVSDKGLKSVAAKLEQPTLEEGFRAIYSVDQDGVVQHIAGQI